MLAEVFRALWLFGFSYSEIRGAADVIITGVVLGSFFLVILKAAWEESRGIARGGPHKPLGDPDQNLGRE